WWKNADDPWQRLSRYVELRTALEFPDLAKLILSLPTHQNDTCNSLQHYISL
ncbi:hypothetical protein BDY19DRAFT_861486, partial [Irpex rosettiformis]